MLKSHYVRGLKWKCWWHFLWMTSWHGLKYKRCPSGNRTDFLGSKTELKELVALKWEKCKENEASHGAKWHFQYASCSTFQQCPWGDNKSCKENHLCYPMLCWYHRWRAFLDSCQSWRTDNLLPIDPPIREPTGPRHLHPQPLSAWTVGRSIWARCSEEYR